MKWAAPFLLAASPATLSSAISTTAAAAVETDSQSEPADITDRLIDDIYDDKAAESLQTIDSLLLKVNDRDTEAYLKGLRGLALLALKKPAEARTEFEAAIKLAPQSPDATRLRFFGGLSFGAREESSLAIDRLIAVFPDIARGLPMKQLTRYLYMKESKGLESVEDQRIALAKIGYGGNAGDFLGMDAVELLIDRGRAGEAEAIVRYVDSRSDLEQALIQKKFVPVWRAIEVHAGGQMSRIEAEAVRLAQVDLDETPDDIERLRALMSALREARRYNEAAAVGARFAITPSEIAKLKEQGGWLVNDHAIALYDAKRFAEGDARFAALIAAHDEHWIVNMKINRLEALMFSGQFEQADRLMAMTEASVKTGGSDYARQLVRRVKLCISHRLGRVTEAKALLPEVIAKAADARAATVNGLLCVGEFNAAEKIVLETLAEKGGHGWILSGLQRRPLSSDDATEWLKGWQLLRKRPSVSAAFNKVGRDLPESMYPAN